jgi:predicted amidohydrolase YtcJ
VTLLFHNGNVFDGLRHLRDTSVAVVGDRIVAVGPGAAVRDVAGSRAQEVDLAGGLLSAGFQDAHIHPMIGGLERLRCDLSGLSTREEYLRAVGAFATARPDLDWIRGGGWSVSAFPGSGPTATDLDAVVPDRPVFLPSTDHHDAWVNTKALEVAGIDEHTPDPPDGWLCRDDSGRPTGTLREAAMALVGRHLTTTRADYHQGLLEGQRFLHAAGITGWQDALLGGYAGIDDPTQAYLDALEEGTLTARVRGALWWDRHRGVEQVEELVDRRAGLRAAGLDAGSVKIMMDGIAETYTASVTEPYVGLSGCPCGDSGLSFMPDDQLCDAVAAADDAGFQVHFHAIGDQAVHRALDALERARRVNGANDHRHQVAHLQLVRPEDRARFRRLGVIANVEALWAQEDTPAVQLLLPFLDEERVGWHYPFADLVRSGARLAGGSDWPVNTPDPVSAIHVAVNRNGYGADGSAFLPEQALTLEQSFATYTSGSAFANHRDDTGAIQVGMRADLTVLDRDPFLGEPEEIGAAQVVATYVGGAPVHQR